MGSLVLAVGLWLRFDPETVALLNGDGAPDTFFYGEYRDRNQPISREGMCELANGTGGGL